MVTAEALANAIATLPPVSPAAVLLLRLVEAPNADVARAAEIIESDPAMMANALRLANSMAFAGAKRVGDAPSAIRRFGLDGMRELAATMLVISGIRAQPDGMISAYGMTHATFVRHSVAVGVFARQMAAVVCPEDIGNAYAAGLLHDVGKLVIEVVVRQQPELITGLGNRALVELEESLLGVDHAQVGAQLARAWRFPDAIVRAIPTHHKPNAQTTKLGHVVALANALAHWYGYGAGSHQSFSTRALNPSAFGQLGVTASMVELCGKQALQRVRASATVFTRAA